MVTPQPIKVPKDVYAGIMTVRDLGEANMLDTNAVINLCFKHNFNGAAYWILNHRKEYSRTIFYGMEVEGGGVPS